jgi:hypothetical protein
MVDPMPYDHSRSLDRGKYLTMRQNILSMNRNSDLVSNPMVHERCALCRSYSLQYIVSISDATNSNKFVSMNVSVYWALLIEHHSCYTMFDRDHWLFDCFPIDSNVFSMTMPMLLKNWNSLISTNEKHINRHYSLIENETYC